MKKLYKILGLTVVVSVGAVYSNPKDDFISAARSGTITEAKAIEKMLDLISDDATRDSAVRTGLKEAAVFGKVGVVVLFWQTTETKTRIEPSSSGAALKDALIGAVLPVVLEDNIQGSQIVYSIKETITDSQILADKEAVVDFLINLTYVSGQPVYTVGMIEAVFKIARDLKIAIPASIEGKLIAMKAKLLRPS